MTRLIDADALIERLNPYKDKYGAEEFPYNMVQDAFIYEVEQEPTVDAVPVIRCKDCKYCTEKSKAIKKHCIWWYRSVDDDDYCSKVERKEE